PDIKSGDFDPGFLPLNRRMRERWTRIYLAMVEGDELPPIDVYKVDDRYYVIDGHHRVSVARRLGRPAINARVINVRTRAPIGSDTDAQALLGAAEYAHFLEATQLHRTRPEARLVCSRLGRYDEIIQHIAGHRYFLSREQKRDVSLQEASRIEQEFKLKHLSTGSILRHEVALGTPTGKEAGRIMAAGDLVPDELIVDIVRGRLPEAEAEAAGVLLDGFPRTERQARALDAMLADEGHQVDRVLALEVPEADLIDRLLHRAQVEGRADD